MILIPLIITIKSNNPMEKRIIGVATDHAGFPLKQFVLQYLEEKGYEIKDFGTWSDKSVDYPDFAHPLADAIENGTGRRVGWFDSVALRHAKRVAGINALSLNLLDVFSGFDKIKIATAYELDGEKIDYYPASLKELYRCKPVYEELPAWEEDITNVKTWEDLPENAKKFLNRVSELVGVPLVTVSVGPDREQTIVLKNPWEM